MNARTILANRRQFLKTMATTAGAVGVAPLLTGCSPASFAHGVASGDPLSDQVVIWTRVTPSGTGKVLVGWEIARDARFRRVEQSGKTMTDDTVDYTVKVDVEGLKPGRKYYYRFRCLGDESPVGETRTLPRQNVKELTFAVFSCSNYPAGYFNVYKEAAKRCDEIDYALHLGDYIYEYGRSGYASDLAAELGREVNPETEILTLSDYRTRYGQYRSDPDLQLVHQKLPFVTVWDDHEITNDTYKDGAQNHNEGEGDFEERKAFAIQAYYEWMPIRETEVREEIYRSFDFGKLLTLHMLDTRVIGRDMQLDYANFFGAGGFDAEAFTAALTDSARTLLGTEQEEYVEAALVKSEATWQVLGQQVLMTSLYLPAPLYFGQIDLLAYQALLVKAQTDPASLTPEELAILSAPSVPFNLDAWDGYPAAREKVLQTAVALNKNLISLAGDTHNAWASNLDTTECTPAGVEFATSSVSSPGAEAYLPDIPPDLLAASLVQISEGLQWANTQHRGFMTLTVTKEKAVATWIFVDTVISKDYSVLESRTQTLAVEAGVGRVVPA